MDAATLWPEQGLEPGERAGLCHCLGTLSPGSESWTGEGKGQPMVLLCGLCLNPRAGSGMQELGPFAVCGKQPESCERRASLVLTPSPVAAKTELKGKKSNSSPSFGRFACGSRLCVLVLLLVEGAIQPEEEVVR